ncbi:MAG: ABC transporter permease [Planctomycetaceae bacterium]
MRPYLAVIGDSFRAAFSSRVLWVALAAIYLFLFSIAPIGYREVFTTTFRWFDFSNGTRMKAMLAQDIDRPTPTPAGMIARALPTEIQGNLRKVAQGQEVRIRLDLLADSLNSLLDKDDWYSEEVWQSTNRLRELRELDAAGAGELSDELKRRRSRLRIEAALPGVFENRSARSIALTYAGFDFPAVFQIDPSQFKIVLNHFVLRIIIDWVLGFVMIFLGILVTASIVPDMLQPGSLHLLLSKPISRPMLFLAKFVGGCAFVLVCVAQLILGLWLISGLRLGIWNARLLLCIPVCVFLFAVFYSVSAVAGLRWRSPILAIGLANAFGALCLIIGIVGSVSDGFITEPDRIESLAVSGDTLIASTRGANLRQFDEATHTWVDLFADDNGDSDRILPPITLADGRIVTARVRGGRMNLFGSGATSLLILDAADQWKPVPSIELPAATSQLLATGRGELIAINSSELLMTGPESLLSADSSADPDSATAGQDSALSGGPTSQWIPKLLKMMGAATDEFRSLAPREVAFMPPRSIGFTPDDNSVFVYSSGKLVRLDRPADDESEEPWPIAARVDVDAGNQQLWVRVLRDRLVVLRSQGDPLLFDHSLAPIALAPSDFEFAKLDINEVTTCQSAGTLAIVTSEGDAYLLKLTPAAPGQGAAGLSARKISGLGDIDSATWDDRSQTLWLSHHVDAVAAYDVSSLSFKKRISPKLKGWRLVDKYGVTPLRTITPQTGELGETIAAIVSGESTMQLPIAQEVPETQRYNVWRPVLTCAGFIAVMLTIGSVYFNRADF